MDSKVTPTLASCPPHREGGGKRRLVWHRVDGISNTQVSFVSLLCLQLPRTMVKPGLAQMFPMSLDTSTFYSCFVALQSHKSDLLRMQRQLVSIRMMGSVEVTQNHLPFALRSWMARNILSGHISSLHFSLDHFLF